ncbi:MAG: hypothetical protein WA958_09065 [Tunicatimonas sp.]
MRPIFLFLSLLGSSLIASAQQPWSVATYPDESGYQRRIAGKLANIAAQPFAFKSKAASRCPDTGLSVRHWAVKGETVTSPFTGRAYVQGETGYFGPKERGSDGQIVRFGGDPLKRDLPPATAHLMLHPSDVAARAYLSIPGNLRQQYHFAAKNWARFYPLFGQKMGPKWSANFRVAVANYQEARLPSDGPARQYIDLSVPHDLIGETGQLLGGNKEDGGTENHKTMWRTSGLLYAQLFPSGSEISGYPAAEAEQKISVMLKDYVGKMLTTGNGEYDSQIYYPHSIEAFLNLYDFSPDPETKALAKLALDYYLATYALKTYDGAIAGAQKRGPYDLNYAGEMREMLYHWFGSSLGNQDKFHTSLHQITSSYRPNRVIYNILRKNIDVPFEARMARPYYHMDVSNRFQEYFYGSKSFGLGSVYITQVDNPNQQISWSLVMKGKHGPLSFGGLQPYHRAPGGYSPYTQTLQSKNVILVATAPTMFTRGKKTDEQTSRQESIANQPLRSLAKPTSDSLGHFLKQAKYQAATWLFIPQAVNQLLEKNGSIFIDADSAYVAVTPTTANYYWLEADTLAIKAAIPVDKRADKLLDNRVLVVPGTFSGYALEAHEKTNFTSLKDFAQAVSRRSNFTVDTSAQRLHYQTSSGVALRMQYQPQSFRCTGSIDGQPLNFDNWADGKGYQSPYVTTGKGKMTLTDGQQGYTVDYSAFKAVYRPAE